MIYGGSLVSCQTPGDIDCIGLTPGFRLEDQHGEIRVRLLMVMSFFLPLTLSALFLFFGLSAKIAFVQGISRPLLPRIQRQAFVRNTN